MLFYIWFLTAAIFFMVEFWTRPWVKVLCEQSICCSHTGLDLEALQLWNGPPASGLRLTINLCVLVDWLSHDRDWGEVKGYHFRHEISGFHFANWSCLQVQTVSCIVHVSIVQQMNYYFCVHRWCWWVWVWALLPAPIKHLLWLLPGQWELMQLMGKMNRKSKSIFISFFVCQLHGVVYEGSSYWSHWG